MWFNIKLLDLNPEIKKLSFQIMSDFKVLFLDYYWISAVMFMCYGIVIFIFNRYKR